MLNIGKCYKTDSGITFFTYSNNVNTSNQLLGSSDFLEIKEGIEVVFTIIDIRETNDGHEYQLLYDNKKYYFDFDSFQMKWLIDNKHFILVE